MPQRTHLSEFEHLVLLALVRRGGTSYGMQVRREIEQTSGRTTSIGAVYATLERLQQKGHIGSWRSDPEPRRGGRRRRFFRVEPSGARALAAARDTLDRMWDGVALDIEAP